MNKQKNKRYWGEEAPEVADESKNEVLVKEPKVLELSHNRIYFYSEIDRSSILTLNKNLFDLKNDYISEQQKYYLKDPKPIFLHIQSYGGSIFAGIAGTDQILKIKETVPVYTIVDGCVASAGTFLTVVGTRRYINKNAYMLIHQLSSVMWGKYEEFKDEMKNLEALMSMIEGLYKQYTSVPINKLHEILKHDLWFDAKTCLKYGLVDEIL